MSDLGDDSAYEMIAPSLSEACSGILGPGFTGQNALGRVFCFIGREGG